jgi:hypothetical protein
MCAGRTVNQKQPPLIPTFHTALHRVLQQLHRHLERHNRALLDVRLNHLAELAPGAILLLAQQISRGQVFEPVVRYQLCALRSLPRARAAQDKYHRHGIGTPEWRGARRGAEVGNRRHLDLMRVRRLDVPT